MINIDYTVDHTNDTIEKYDPYQAMLDQINHVSAEHVLGWNYKDMRRLKSLKKGGARSRLNARYREYKDCRKDLTITAEDCDNNIKTYHKLVEARERLLNQVAMEEHLVYNNTNPLHQFNDEIGEKNTKPYDPTIIEFFIDKESYIFEQKINKDFGLFIELLNKDGESLTGKYSIITLMHQGVDDDTSRYLEKEKIYVGIQSLTSTKTTIPDEIGRVYGITFKTSMKKLIHFIKNYLQENNITIQNVQNIDIDYKGE